MGLLQSPEHYEIMINPNAKYVGIGIGVDDEHDSLYYLYIVFGS